MLYDEAMNGNCKTEVRKVDVIHSLEHAEIDSGMKEKLGLSEDVWKKDVEHYMK